MSRLIIGPFNRVEGDLEVRLDTSADQVQRAEVTSPLYRGFERMLHAKPLPDALVYAPRICGICSVSQSVAAARALAAMDNRAIPPAGAHAINIVHAVENLADHFTHFYLFFMPDFARETYAPEPWHQAAAERFAAVKGTATRDALPARAGLMQLMGILAGKWPHTLSIQPDGSTRAITRSEKARAGVILTGFRGYLERTLFGDRLENVAALSSRDALYAWAEAQAARPSDFAHFIAISRALDLASLGRTSVPHMSFGAYPNADGHFFSRGLFRGGVGTFLDLGAIAEDVSHAWYRQGGEHGSPMHDAPPPDATREDAYSWCKAPRLGSEPVEVGALSRQLVAGHPLLRDIVRLGGASVEARIVARMLELALVVPAMERWLAAIDTDAAFIDHRPLPANGEGVGLTEAARGSLGHWLRGEKGKIDHYQIIAPTTWNFSPRDANGTPGPLEQALEGVPIRAGETEPVAVQHVVRSFDPCMVCTVH
ncbi:nickel-dependent hydrogenase large subunit [Croceicoccus gelatinilyticus]|uniref:nickel-dependent hydrogenase large subunit n=1 Tax=Croceicoccus gelatinilyticus TaxID=2835536 RepID=UPI001BCDB7A1|nr:nickel-dependent hydrogenase large subunit [Croceicoccus gelatinilyticus]MBS7669290.1 nickel-dependent hydrogenase large subunit [Croceicoccus gelatinilyticus]